MMLLRCAPVRSPAPWVELRIPVEPCWVYYTDVRLFPLFLAVVMALAVSSCERNPKARLVGNPAPDFTITDSDHTIALHDLHGKLVLLNFWAAHCGPCIDEMPALVRREFSYGARLRKAEL